MKVMLSWTQNIVVFLILMAMILAIVPSEKYKKYVQLFLGLVLTLFIIQPFLKWTNKDELLKGCLNYYPSILEEMETLPELKKVEAQRNQAILDAYQLQIEEDLTVSAAERGWNIVEIEIQWREEESFGVIEQMQIRLEEKQEENVLVAPIVIEAGKTVETAEEQIEQWKEEIADRYQIAQKCITVKKIRQG